MIRSITLLGSSSGRNAGDAALISGIMDSIDAACGRRLRYEVPTPRPSYLRDNYENDAVPVSMMPWAGSFKMFGIPTYRSVMSTDLSLVFDAVLFDRSLYNPLFNYLSTLYLLLPRAKRRGKRLGCFNVGIGPVSTAPGKRMLRELAEEMDFIATRDEDSLRILREIGVQNPNVFVAADAALVVPGSPRERSLAILRDLGFAPGSEILAININKYLDTWAGTGSPSIGRDRFLETYAAALNDVTAKTGAPLLFVCTQHHDIEITKDLQRAVTRAPHAAVITNKQYNHYEVKGVLGCVGLLCAMRLHANILASSELTPVVGVLYQPKIKHYFRVLGLEEHTLGFDEFSRERLADLILRGWEQRASLRRHLERTIPVLQDRARQAARIVAALSEGRSVADALALVTANDDRSAPQPASRTAP